MRLFSSLGLRRGAASAIVLAVLSCVSSGHAESRLFEEPQLKGLRLDWCLYWAQDCGEPAANAFCRIWGFDSVQRYAIDQNVGRRGIVTLVLGDGRLCGAATCSGFRWVACQSE